MTDDELDRLLTRCPTLFHMADRNGWPSIRRHGLLSTSALLERWGVADEDAITARHRPQSMTIDHAEFGKAVVRDQKPMDDAGLRRCLIDMEPAEWYRLLNARVFFWLTKKRLIKLLKADAYRESEHLVLELDSRRLVEAYRHAITLSPINSGATKPMPAPRGRDTFRSIAEYDFQVWRKTKGSVAGAVVELTVSPGIPDAASFVTRASIMRGDECLCTVFEAPTHAAD